LSEAKSANSVFMLITKSGPVGLDKAIQQIQTDLYRYLLKKWFNLDSKTQDTDQYHCHGRCYRNKQVDNGYIAEVFSGDATQGEKDYKEVYWNDNISAISFFSVSDKVDNAMGESKVSASAIFFVNVTKLKPAIAHRADEEVRQDLINFFQGASYLGYETGIDNVLREYPGTRKNKLVAVVEVQPVHCFRINLNLKYQNC
jgi:hypothetical protein